jgi:hypothetical protein
MPAGGVKFSTTYGYRWDGGRSIGTNTYSLRVRRANESAASWQPCSADAGNPNCATITGDGALSVYVRTPGTADLFLSKMAPAPDYRGRTIQVQLWDPGEGSRRLKILEPVPTSVDASGWKEVPFSWSTSNPGLADSAGTLVVDHAYGWDIGGNRVPIATSASNGLDVSGNYDPASGMTPWPLNERYSQSKFNGRLVTIDIKVPDDYGKDAGGAELAPSQFQDGWWKIRYESNSGVEDRTTWVVSSGSGPVHLARSPS